jgi:hypothetical protein
LIALIINAHRNCNREPGILGRSPGSYRRGRHERAARADKALRYLKDQHSSSRPSRWHCGQAMPTDAVAASTGG